MRQEIWANHLLGDASGKEFKPAVFVTVGQCFEVMIEENTIDKGLHASD